MLICECCGSVFDETEMVIRHSFEYGQTQHCPICDSEEIESAIQCNYCGEWIVERESNEGFCEECASKTLKLFREVLINTFSEEQIDFLSHSDCF